MEPEKLGEIVSVLREGRWGDYESLVRGLLDGENKDQLWEMIAATHPAELNLINILSNWPQELGRSACNYFLPAIGKLRALELADALRLLEFASHLESSYRLIPAETLRPHIAKRPALGTEIGEHLRAARTSDEASQRIWAGAFATAAPKEAANYAISLLADADPDSQLLALLVLFLPTESPEVRTALVAREKDVADFLYGSASQVGQVAWAALTSVAEVSASAMRYLLAALDAGEQQAAIAMSNTLYRVKSSAVGVTGEPLERIVQRLLAIGLENEQVRAHVDQGIESLLFRDSVRPHAVSCLHDLCTAEGKVTEIFGATFRGLSENSGDFACILTAWLLRSDANFQAIESLLSRCTTQQAPVGLDTSAFVATSTERRVKAARRLLALTHHGPTLCQFIASLAEMTALGPERFDLASQMLNEVFAEYPGATEEFLRAKVKVYPRSDPVAPVYRGVYANVLRWRRVLARLPVLKELRPTDSELHALRTMRRRMNRDILRGATEHSVFANIVTSVHVAQGRRFASHNRFGSPQVVEMRQASHSVELPSSELADPMRGLLQRLSLRRGAR